MPSKFGGIPVAAPGGSKFGGVPLAPVPGSEADSPGALQRKFWQASRDGDEPAKLDALRRLKAQGKTTGSPPNMTDDAARNTADEDSMGANAIAGLGLGARKVTRGLSQAAAMTNPVYWVDPNARAAVDNMLPDNPVADDPLTDTVFGMTSNIGAQAVPFALAPEVRSARGAAALAGLQGYTAPLPTGQNTIQNRVAGAAIAAPLGATGYSVTRGAANAGRGVYNEEAQATIDAGRRLSERTGVPAPLTAGDLGSPTVRQLQDVVFENTPLSGRVREMGRQQRAVTAGVDDLKTRFPPTSDHPETIMQRSMLEAQSKAKERAGDLYDVVDATARASGAPRVRTPAAAATLANSIKEYPELLSGVGNSVTRKKIEGVMARQGVSTSFADTREIMSAVRGELAEAQKRLASGAPGAKDSVLHLGRLARALETDQQAWAKQAGGPTMKALGEANAYFRKNVVPYRAQRELRSVVAQDANPEGLLRGSGDSFESAARRMAAMTPEGQDAFRRGLVQKALTAGTREDGQLNLRTLINNLPTGRAAEQIFSPADQLILNDLARYAKAVDRSLSVGTTPLTGKQVAKLTPAVIAGGAAASSGGLPAVAGGIAFANLSRRVASSRVLRALLHTKPADTQFARIAGQQSIAPIAAASNAYILPAGTNALGLLTEQRVQRR